MKNQKIKKEMLFNFLIVKKILKLQGRKDKINRPIIKHMNKMVN